MEKKEIVVHVCGLKLCRDGKPHDDDKTVILRDSQGREIGMSVACSRCGSSAMERDLLQMP